MFKKLKKVLGKARQKAPPDSISENKNRIRRLEVCRFENSPPAVQAVKRFQDKKILNI